MPHLHRTSRIGARAWLALIPLLCVVGAAALPRSAAADSLDERVSERPEWRLYLGMWTVHLREVDRGVDANHLIGLAVGRYYAGTFINSFDRRAYTAGIQGTVVRFQPGPVNVQLGYRAGLVTGYDERFIAIAGKTPVLPLVHPRVNFEARRLGVEFSYSGVIASAALNVRF